MSSFLFQMSEFLNPSGDENQHAKIPLFLTCEPRQKCNGLTHSFQNQGNVSWNWLQLPYIHVKKFKNE